MIPVLLLGTMIAFGLMSCVTEAQRVALNNGMTEQVQAFEGLVASGNLEQALADIEKNPDLVGNSTNASLIRANIYLASGKTLEAEEIFEGLVSLDKTNSEAYFGLAMIALQKGDASKHKLLLQKTLNLDSSHALALAFLGESQMSSKDYVAAERSFVASLKRDPDGFVAISGLANLLARQDKMPDALKVFDQALKLYPDEAFLLSGRAKVLEQLDRVPDSLIDFARAIELEPLSAWHYLDRGRILARANKTIEAIVDFSKVLDLNKDIFIAQAYRAESYWQQGKTEQAIADFEAVLLIKQDYYPAFEPLALAYYKTAEFQKSASLFSKAYDPIKKNERMLMLAALAWFQGQSPEEAKKQISSLMTKLPQNGLWYSVLRFYIEPSAEAWIVNSIQTAKASDERTLAEFFVSFPLLKAGRTQTGLIFLKKVLESLPDVGAETQIARWKLSEYER